MGGFLVAGGIQSWNPCESQKEHRSFLVGAQLRSKNKGAPKTLPIMLLAGSTLGASCVKKSVEIEQTSNVVTSAILQGSLSSQAPEVSEMKIPGNL